jgi:hypothetical protein
LTSYAYGMCTVRDILCPLRDCAISSILLAVTLVTVIHAVLLVAVVAVILAIPCQSSAFAHRCNLAKIE